MMNMLSGELSYRDYKSKQSLFVLPVEGEWRAIVRPKEIQMCGASPLEERLAQTACLPGSQDRTALAECFVRKLRFERLSLVFLLMLFRSRLRKLAATKTLIPPSNKPSLGNGLIFTRPTRRCQSG
jgi:hypothetical protein